MVVPLLLSSLAAGLIATTIMVFFLYLPQLWRGAHFDVLNALGSAITRKVDGRSLLIGALIYFGGGLIFSVLYGLLALVLIGAGLNDASNVPELSVLAALPVNVDLIYPLLGLMLGLAHGGIVALLVTIVVIEHHPLERFRGGIVVALSQIISHLVFGATVMFFHSQFLQLLLGRG